VAKEPIFRHTWRLKRSATMQALSGVVLNMLALAVFVGCAGAHDPESIGHTRSGLYGGHASSFWSNTVRLDANCTGVLLHPYLVASAAHCGVAERVSTASDEVEVRECIVSPEWGAVGVDLMICKLQRPLRGSSVIPPATGCELDYVTPGASVTLVGYGATNPEEAFGTLTSSEGVVESSGAELRIDGEFFGGCEGDSGGPAISVVPDGDWAAFRVSALMSAGGSGYCRVGPAFYTPLAPHVAWIEAASQIDVTPCGDADGMWNPSVGCSAWPKEVPTLSGERPATTCGPAGPDATVDAVPPRVELLSNPASNSAFADTLTVAATDEGSGIRAVIVELTRDGQSLWGDVRSTGPFTFTLPKLEPGTYEASATALDFAGHTSMAQTTLTLQSETDAAAACSMSPGQPKRPATAELLGASGVALLLRLVRLRPRGTRA
jgi:hypothetical protein